MTKYSFKCDSCSKEYQYMFSVEDYISNKNSLKCPSCKDGTLKRVFRNFNFKIDKTSSEILEDIKLEKEKLKEKINSGDIKTISDIYGE